MIAFKTGDLLVQDAEALVNTVNCVGIMGRGVALQFKKKFPENFKAYAAACKRNEVVPGKMFVYETHTITNPHFIINFPTKRHWRGQSRIEDIKAGLDDLVRVLAKYNIHSIVLPPLGCGLGGLDWSAVKPAIESKLAELSDVNIVVFGPGTTLHDKQMVHNKKFPDMTPGRAALIELIQRYLGSLLDPYVTLLEIHKLMYFLQEAGEPLKLKYAKAPYGPYAENLRHVLHAIEGYYISGYADGGDTPKKQITLIPGAYEDATAFLAGHSESKGRLERVGQLVEGFETPFGLELLATVHWIMTRENTREFNGIRERTYAWGERKKQFTSRQIELAATTLSDKGWVTSRGYP